MASTILTVVGGLATVAGNIVSANEMLVAADREASAQRSAIEEAGRVISESEEKQTGAIKEGTDAQREALSPYSTAGSKALDAYLRGINDPSAITESPGYQFREERLMKGISQQAAASGKSRSGVALAEYYAPGINQLTADETNQYFSRLNPLIQTGYGAAQGIASAEGQGASSLSNIYGNTASQQSAFELKKGDVESSRIGKKAKAKTDMYKGIVDPSNKVLQDVAYFQGKGGS